MFTLVIGGAASGKSEYAESRVTDLPGRRIYLATMRPWDQECRNRIDRHRRLRLGKGFETLERYTDLAGAEIPAGANVLLECMSNLTANELYDPEGGGREAVLRGVDALLARCGHLTVVTNEVFSGGAAYGEGMEVVPDPGIISPKAFLDECIKERFPNPYLGDTCLRLCTDSSQGLGVRFGVTIKSYVEKYGDAGKLTGIPLAIAGWLRYLLGVDDNGSSYELAPDPMAEEMQKKLSTIVIGEPSSLTDQLKWSLSNENVFFINLYKAGIGTLIEEIFREEIAGPGAVRATLQKYLAQV